MVTAKVPVTAHKLLEVRYEIVYVPAVEVDRSISPVDALILNPVVELNVPPVVPVMVGVGLVPDLQNTMGFPVNKILSAL